MLCFCMYVAQGLKSFAVNTTCILLLNSYTEKKNMLHEACPDIETAVKTAENVNILKVNDVSKW